MMFRIFALLYGILFTTLGILGFIQSEGLLFSIFKVNAGINGIHLLAGLNALWVAFIPTYYTRLYFQIIGFIFAIIALFGFIYGDHSILGFIASNSYDTWLHVIFAVLGLIVGFGTTNLLEKNHNNDEGGI